MPEGCAAHRDAEGSGVHGTSRAKWQVFSSLGRLFALRLTNHGKDDIGDLAILLRTRCWDEPGWHLSNVVLSLFRSKQVSQFLRHLRLFSSNPNTDSCYCDGAGRRRTNATPITR